MDSYGIFHMNIFTSGAPQKSASLQRKGATILGKILPGPGS